MREMAGKGWDGIGWVDEANHQKWSDANVVQILQTALSVCLFLSNHRVVESTQAHRKEDVHSRNSRIRYISDNKFQKVQICIV